MKHYIVTTRLFHTTDGRVVGLKDPNCAYLLFPEGEHVTQKQVDEFGIAEFVRPEVIETEDVAEAPSNVITSKTISEAEGNEGDDGDDTDDEQPTLNLPPSDDGGF
jgi:hypothetical protein